MINILNLNPSIDYFMTTKEFELNKTNHSEFESISLGGKGSNVGILLNNLDVKSKMHGFVGGFTGSFIKSQMEQYESIDDNMIDSKQLSRINVKLKYEGETEINGVGKVIPKEFIKKLESNLDKLKDGDVLVMTGRTANGMPHDWYLKMAKLMKRKNVDFVLDINDPILKNILEYQPLLIKPNEDEIKNIFNHTGNLTEKDLLFYGKQMIKQGAKHVIISLGSKGSLFFYNNKIYTSKNLKGDVKNTVGAGDSMIAGFLTEYQNSFDSLKAYKTAQACGNATAFSNAIAKRELVESIYTQIEIEEIKDEN